jgi:GT2 family glycosyltransferase
VSGGRGSALRPKAMEGSEKKSLGPGRVKNNGKKAGTEARPKRGPFGARRDGKPQAERVGRSSRATGQEDVALDASRAVSAFLDDDRVRNMLYDVKLTLAALRQQSSEGEAAEEDGLVYQECIRRIREIVRRVLPAEAIVVVTSKGDEDLLDLYGREAWHFPQEADGTYPGSYPADGTGVIAHLETLRAKGAGYFLFPQPALWWLDAYPKFARHLEYHYPVVFRDEATCVIFQLENIGEVDGSAWRRQLSELISDYRNRFDLDPAILDWETGLRLHDLLPSETVFSPPSPEEGLSYFDQSIPIVAVSSPDKATLREARRVASDAVITLTPLDEEPGLLPDANHWGLAIDIERVGESFQSGPSTSIVIPTYNGLEHLDLCLAALEETLPEPFLGEVLVVDDCSGEETRALLREWQDSRLGLKVIRNRGNCGFVVSCNRGAHAATGDILVFLNDDTLPQARWLPALLRIFRDCPDAGAAGGRLLYPDGRLQEAGNVIFSDGSGANFGRGDYAVDDPLYNHVRVVDYCSAALLATPRAVFTELGGFDERFRPAYYEDTDYCFNLREHGYHVYYQPESVVVHSEGATSGTDLSSGVKRYQAVNQTKFVKKWDKALKRQPDNPGRFDLRTWHALAAAGVET